METFFNEHFLNLLYRQIQREVSSIKLRCVFTFNSLSNNFSFFMAKIVKNGKYRKILVKIFYDFFIHWLNKKIAKLMQVVDLFAYGKCIAKTPPPLIKVIRHWKFYDGEAVTRWCSFDNFNFFLLSTLFCLR